MPFKLKYVQIDKQRTSIQNIAHRIAILLALCFAAAVSGGEDRERTAALMRSYREDGSPRVFLLSYPRSGNTWIRFCLEYLTHRPTLSFKEEIEDLRPYSAPLGLSIPELETDLSKPCIWKVHSRQRMEQIAPFDPKSDKLIFLVRNHRDCLLRNFSSISQVFQELRNPDSIFYGNFSVYEEWDPANRLLIYYEDFLEDPEAVLKAVLLFLDERPTRLPKFLSEFDALKTRSLSYYRQEIGPTRSQGTVATSLPPSLKTAMDQAVIEHMPHLWEAYLSRYSSSIR